MYWWMRKTCLISIIILSCLACEAPVDQKSTSGYFDLEELLEAQVENLGKATLKSEKLIEINEATDRIDMDFDAVQLKEELSIFAPFDPGQSRYRNAFDVSESNGVTTYTRKEGVNQSLRWVTIARHASLLEVSAEIIEETSIYTNQKKMSLTLESDQIKSFSLIGYQKMLFKDTAFFEMRVTIE